GKPRRAPIGGDRRQPTDSVPTSSYRAGPPCASGRTVVGAPQTMHPAAPPRPLETAMQLPRRMIDLSSPLDNDTILDHPFMRPKIEYRTNAENAPMLLDIFPGLRRVLGVGA